MSSSSSSISSESSSSESSSSISSHSSASSESSESSSESSVSSDSSSSESSASSESSSSLQEIEVLTQWTDDTRAKMMPSGSYLDTDNIIYATWSEPVSGYGIATNRDYIHRQTVASSTWLVQHNYGDIGILIQFLDDDLVLIQPETVTLTNANLCTATFGSAITGIAIVIPVPLAEETKSIYDSIYYWKVGNGGSDIWDPVLNNDLESMTLSGTDFVSVSGADVSYINFQVEDDSEMEITEMGLFDNEDTILFYTHNSLIYKPSNVIIDVHYKLNRTY